MMPRIAFLLLLLVTATTCFAQPPADQKAIDKLRQSFLTAFNKGDAAALEKIYEPDAMLLTFGGQVVTGGKGIAMGMASMSSQMDLDLKPLRFRESGDLAYESGTWSHLKKGTKEVVQMGTFVWVWKKEKSDWRLDTISVTAAPGVPVEIK